VIGSKVDISSSRVALRRLIFFWQIPLALQARPRRHSEFAEQLAFILVQYLDIMHLFSIGSLAGETIVYV
jgi:hypothetical protein